MSDVAQLSGRSGTTRLEKETGPFAIIEYKQRSQQNSLDPETFSVFIQKLSLTENNLVFRNERSSALQSLVWKRR